MAMTSTERLRPSRTFSLRNTLRGGAKLPMPRPKTAESRQFAGAGSRASQQFFDAPQQLPEFEPSPGNGKGNRDSCPVRPSTEPQKDGVVVVASAKKITGKSFGVGGLRAGVGRTFSLSRGSSSSSSLPARAGPDQPPIAISTPAKPTKVLDDSADRRTRVTTNSSAKELPNYSTANSPAAADGTSKFKRPTQGSASTNSDSSASSLDEQSSKDGDTSTAASSITSYSSTKSSEGRGGKQGTKPLTPPTRAGDALKKPRRGLNVFTRSSNSNASSIPRTNSSSTMSSRSPSVGGSAATFKTKDDMWEPYKILESDYSKYAAPHPPGQTDHANVGG